MRDTPYNFRPSDSSYIIPLKACMYMYNRLRTGDRTRISSWLPSVGFRSINVPPCSWLASPILIFLSCYCCYLYTPCPLLRVFLVTHTHIRDSWTTICIPILYPTQAEAILEPNRADTACRYIVQHALLLMPSLLAVSQYVRTTIPISNDTLINFGATFRKDCRTAEPAAFETVSGEIVETRDAPQPDSI